ncbi:hypothetical protein [Brevibacillus choshinensis]|uniref:DUF433 domain-containing protein n=1 Tax=Brevibacillus choshinensis TaxID=54911 RepID=A0ABX7FML2_BRECH|nr:hypothetical protein [Brevibacillus choshinensis]QRG66924.1 hypothetical protein JNE38_26175 [Brevibacillus choshinensis]
MLKSYQVNIIGRACVTRYDAGEGTLDEIVNTSYPNLSEDDATQVKAYVYSIRPDIE